MKMKKTMTLLCTALLTIGSVCGCNAAEPTADTAKQTEISEEAPQPATLAEITAIDGTTATLQLMGGRGGFGMRDFENGEKPPMGDDAEKPEMGDPANKPDKKEGQQPPNKDNGEAPAMPDGIAPSDMERPEMNGEQPSFPAAEPMTIDLAEFENIDPSALAVGDFLSLTMDADGNITAVVMAELPEMPTDMPPASEEQPSA